MAIDEMPNTVEECKSLLDFIDAEVSSISTDLEAARLMHESGKEIDWEWYRRASTARRHKKQDIATIKQQITVLLGTPEERMLRNFEMQKALSEARRAEKQRIKDENIARSESEHHRKFYALWDMVKDRAPALVPDAIREFQKINAEMRDTQQQRAG